MTKLLLSRDILKNAKFRKNSDDFFCWNFEVGAVQKSVNHLDLAKSFHMSIYYLLVKIGDTAENEPLNIWRWIYSFIHSPPYPDAPPLSLYLPGEEHLYVRIAIENPENLLPLHERDLAKDTNE